MNTKTKGPHTRWSSIAEKVKSSVPPFDEDRQWGDLYMDRDGNQDPLRDKLPPNPAMREVALGDNELNRLLELERYILLLHPQFPPWVGTSPDLNPDDPGDILRTATTKLKQEKKAVTASSEWQGPYHNIWAGVLNAPVPVAVAEAESLAEIQAIEAEIAALEGALEVGGEEAEAESLAEIQAIEAEIAALEAEVAAEAAEEAGAYVKAYEPPQPEPEPEPEPEHLVPSNQRQSHPLVELSSLRMDRWRQEMGKQAAMQEASDRKVAEELAAKSGYTGSSTRSRGGGRRRRRGVHTKRKSKKRTSKRRRPKKRKSKKRTK